MELKEITNYLEKMAPTSLQEAYDNSGLLIGESGKEVNKALITLDVTDEVLDEAISKECNLVIAHHPLIFKGIKRFNGKSFTDRLVTKAIKHDIAIYAIHTNLDNVDIGVNSMLAQKIGLQKVRILSPKNDQLRKLITFCPVDHAEKVRKAIFAAGAGNIGEYDSCSFNQEGLGSFKAGENADPFVGEVNELHYEKEYKIESVYPVYMERQVINAMIDAHPYEEVAYDVVPLKNEYLRTGSGMIGELENNEDELAFLKRIKKVLGSGTIRYSRLLNKDVKKVALCGGAGSFLIDDAIVAGADVFITGDVKYHQFFDANGKMVIADVGHYESEQFTKELIHQLLMEKFSNFAVLISERNTNSVNYL
ncbi:MAG: Nif3-like dinuclear metal center hexameric protein [Bacteroidales bacterium]|nr:Nif3-like dinuclear metal center hexameric protein [Bacteroidales bacterium]